MNLHDLSIEVFESLRKSPVYFGHGTDNAWDEAVALVLQGLNLPFDVAESVVQSPVDSAAIKKIKKLLALRIQKRIPLPYLFNKAYFAGLEFYVDSRVLIPRSPMAECIEQQFKPWVNPEAVSHILDIGTGSACLAIACAHYFPKAKVDASDVSEEALAVAQINIDKHQLKSRVKLINSDVFNHIHKKYNLIISNPPYVDKKEMQQLPKEYYAEPKIALQAETSGLSIILKILAQAVNYLMPKGILVVEAGQNAKRLQQHLPNMPFVWLEFERGGDGVFLVTREELLSAISG